MALELNRRNNDQFGTGLPIYDRIDRQQRFNTKRSYYLGLLPCPFDRVPTFQVKFPEEIDVVDVFDATDTFFTNLSIGIDGTFDIIKQNASDGDFVYICGDYGKGVNIQGIHYLGFRLSADPVGVYRYYSEQFEGLVAPCILNNPVPA